MACKNVHLGYISEFLDNMPGTSHSTNEEHNTMSSENLPSSTNGQVDVPKYTEQDMQNAIRQSTCTAIRGLKRKIEDILQCIICKDIPREGQIKQCQNGHLACENCMNNVNLSTCAVCRDPLGNKRTRALNAEQLIEAADLELPCRHADCEVKAPKRDLVSHEKNCKYRKDEIREKCAICITDVPAKEMKWHVKAEHGFGEDDYKTVSLALQDRLSLALCAAEPSPSFTA